MADQDEFRFKIEAFSPETIPMARLAEYMAQLAALLGQPERVHFARLEKGSTQILGRIEHEAVPKVRTRLTAVAANDAPDDAREAFTKIDRLLREDNARGDLSTQGAQILRFPGKDRVEPETVGPFWQATQVEGVLVRIVARTKPRTR